MKHKLMVPALFAISALAVTSCGKKTEAEADAIGAVDVSAASTGTPGGRLLDPGFPPEIIEGTPKPVNVPNLLPKAIKAPEFFVPDGDVLLSKGKTVSSSDSNPIIGSLDLITDSDKQGGEGYVVELMDGTQWVQIDLEKSSVVHAAWIWHFHADKQRAYHDIIVQVSDDAEFKSGVTTVFNNDYDNSSKLGKGSDNPYVESRFGKVVDGKGTKGRYVRLYSMGNTSSEMNHYTEVEIYGIAS